MKIIRNFWLFKKDLLVISRLHTSLYAFVLAIIGYKLTLITNWEIILLSSCLFALITSNIMIFNDIIDRESDFIRGKTFVHYQHKLVLLFWLITSVSTLVLMTILFFISIKLSFFCLLVWATGLVYSYIQKIYIIQNVLVSFCSASPLLLGTIYHGKINVDILLIFTSLCLIIFSREILGDIKHKKADIGYKTTIPIQTEDKYPANVSYLNLYSISIFIPKSVKKNIDLQLEGEFLETHKIMSSLLSYAPLFLISILGSLVLLPTLALGIANSCTFLCLASNKNELSNWLSMALKLHNFAILFLLILLILK